MSFFVYDPNASGPEKALTIPAFNASEAAEKFAMLYDLPRGKNYLMVKTDMWEKHYPFLPEWTKYQVTGKTTVVYEALRVRDDGTTTKD